MRGGCTVSLPERTYLLYNGWQHRAVTITNFLLKTLKRKECFLRSYSTCFHLARFARPELLWSVNILARVGHKSGTTLVIKDCSGCSYTSMSQKTTDKIVMCETENEDCKLGLFQDASFAGDLQDSKSHSGGLFCVLRFSYVCADCLDVQEAISSIPQQCRERQSFQEQGFDLLQTVLQSSSARSPC